MKTQIKYLGALVEDLELSHSSSSSKEKMQHFIGFVVFPRAEEIKLII